MSGREHQFAVSGLRGFQRHAIQRHDPAFETGEGKGHHPRIGGVDQAEAEAIMLACGAGGIKGPVGGDEVAEAACVAQVVEISEIIGDLSGFRV